MEEQLTRKDAIGVVVKEPVKDEVPVTTPEGTERCEGVASPPPNCSICLGKLINTSFTDSCLHQFCFNCLLQWSKIKTECPLCKQTFKSIIHNVRSEEDYDQYHVPRELAPPVASSQVPAIVDNSFELIGIRRFAYRTTITPDRRYSVIQASRRIQMPIATPATGSRDEQRYRRGNGIAFRRNVYRLGEWSNLLPSVFARFRDSSADYFRTHPYELSRLVPWINRKLQILLNANEPHIAFVLRVVMDVLTRYDLRSSEFWDFLRPYFGEFTEHFAHELLNEALDGGNMSNYPTHGLGTSSPSSISSDVSDIRVLAHTNILAHSHGTSSSSSTSSDDSDIRVLQHTNIPGMPMFEIPLVGPHIIDMPGPSTVGETFRVPGAPMSPPEILTISTSSSSSDECAVVGYVKPRHERTPEIIELMSSDGGNGPPNNEDINCHTPLLSVDECLGGSNEDNQRGGRKRSLRKSSRRATQHRWSTTSSPTSDEAGSDYSPQRSKKSARHNQSRTRARDHVRSTRSQAQTERLRPAQGSSNASQKQPTASPNAGEANGRRMIRRNIRDRTQTLRELFVNSDSESSESDADERRKSARQSSGKARKTSTKSRKRLRKKSRSSCASQSDESEKSTERTDKKRRYTRRKISVCESVEATSVEKSSHDYLEKASSLSIHATILRKDSTKPDEWYVKQNIPHRRSRSLSSSSSSSSSSTSSDFTTSSSSSDSLSSSTSSSSVTNSDTRGSKKDLSSKGKRNSREKHREIQEKVSTSRRDSGKSRSGAAVSKSREKNRSKSKNESRERTNRDEKSDISKSTHSRHSSTAASGSKDKLEKRKRESSRDDQSKRKDSERSRRDGKKDKTSKSSNRTKTRRIIDEDANRDVKEDTGAKGEHSSGNIQDNKSKSKGNSENEGKHSRDKKRDHAKKYDDAGSENRAKKKDNFKKSNKSSRKHSSSGKNDQPGTSRSSTYDRESPSRDKYKDKRQKQKTKRRRSRSETKLDRGSAKREVARSSSYTGPAPLRSEA